MSPRAPRPEPPSQTSQELSRPVRLRGSGFSSSPADQVTSRTTGSQPALEPESRRRGREPSSWLSVDGETRRGQVPPSHLPSHGTSCAKQLGQSPNHKQQPPGPSSGQSPAGPDSPVRAPIRRPVRRLSIVPACGRVRHQPATPSSAAGDSVQGKRRPGDPGVSGRSAAGAVSISVARRVPKQQQQDQRTRMSTAALWPKEK